MKKRANTLFWAADKGYARTQLNLAACYERGRGVEEDQSVAFSWYRLAADQGDPLSQLRLAHRYEYGIGITKDESLGVHFFKLSADQGNSQALSLGNYYSYDEPSRDEELAASYYRLSANKGLRSGMYEIGWKGSGNRFFIRNEISADEEYYSNEAKSLLERNCPYKYDIGIKDCLYQTERCFKILIGIKKERDNLATSDNGTST